MKSLVLLIPGCFWVALAIPVLGNDAVSQQDGQHHCLWQTGCDATKDNCEPGTFCHTDYMNPWTQCQEKPIEIPENCFVTKEGPFGGQRYGCKKDSDCCNENAVCGDDHYCHLQCSLTQGQAIPVQKIQGQGIQGQEDVLIHAAEDQDDVYVHATEDEDDDIFCLWEHGCVTDPTSCEYGTYCYVDEFWSQCRENIATPTLDCFATFNGPFGGTKHGCESNDDCCNPAAVCGADKLCSLSCLDSKPTPSNSDFDILSSNYAAFVKYFTRNDEYIKKTYATKHHTKLENLGLELKMLMKICKLSAGEEECNVLYEEITQELKCLGDSTLPGCTDYNE